MSSDSDDGETLVPPPEGGSRAAGLLSPQQLLAGRFKIIRFLAQGGMGEVYEAEDLELQERVALKTVRSEIDHDSKAMARFKQEIQLARKVTHPNVCRIFDIFHHRTPPSPGSDNDITFLSMELLPGETLAKRLRRAGRMTTAEAFPLVSQMAAALSAAHNAGIIHRDFKSGNVILVPSRHDEEIRVVVTDFGLALANVSQHDPQSLVTTTGSVSGTPIYMAPEQIEGRGITRAIDIYALGLVMYEMVTGSFPFAGETPFSVVLKRLKEAPTPPRTYVPDLDPKWETAILRCLERNPADRFDRSTEVVAALRDEVLSGSGTSRIKSQGVVLAVLALVALIAIAVTYTVYVSRDTHNETPQAITNVSILAPQTRRSVAVLGFKNLSGRPETAWLSTAFSEMFRTELAAGEKLRTIPGENIARMKAELSLADVDSFAKDTLARIQKNLGTDLVVVGSYVSLGGKSDGRIHLDLRLQNTADGETIARIAESGSEGMLFDLVLRAGERLREKLDIAELSTADAAWIRASIPLNPDAARFYSEGLLKLRLFDPMKARVLLDAAVNADPDYPLAHSALAEAWSQLGYDSRAEAEAQKAFNLSRKLPREDQLGVEGRYRETHRQWDKAVEIYRTLWSFSPDNLDYGLRLAEVQVSAGKGKEALLTIEALRKLPAPASADARIDLAEAAVSHSLSDFKREHAAAVKAAAKGKVQGARLLVARTRLLEGWALMQLGEPKKARAAFDDAKQGFAGAGDRGGVARALNNIGLLLKDQGTPAESKSRHQEALAIRREIGDRKGEAMSLNNIALVFEDQGNPAEALKMHEDSLRIGREINDKRGVALSLSNIASIHRKRGDLAAASEMYRKALELRRELGDRGGVAASLNQIAVVLWQQGDLAGAMKMYEESVTVKRETGDRRGEADVLNNIGLVLGAKGDLAGAKKTLEESLKLKRELGLKSALPGSLTNIGNVLLGLGDLAGARTMHDEALLIWRELGNKWGSAASMTNIADVLYHQGDFNGAKKMYQEALQKFNEVGDKVASAECSLGLAKLLLDEGQAAQAETLARQAEQRFQKAKARDLQTYACVLKSRCLLAQGKRVEAQKAIDGAIALSAMSEARDLHQTVAITLARVRAAAGKTAEALSSLETLLADAGKAGLVSTQLVTRLALGEVEMKSGNATSGRDRLKTLEKEAAQKGFGLISRKAAAIR